MVDDPADGPAVNPTAASLLGFLHEGPRSGYDLHRTAVDRIGPFWSVTRSQVYRELAAMASAGLVAAGETGARDRRPYALTDAGREAFVRWVSRTAPPEQIRHPLLLQLAFARHLPPERLAEVVAEHRAAHTAQLARYRAEREQALAAGARPVDLVTLEFGLRYEAAVVDWFAALPQAWGPDDDAVVREEQPGARA